MSEKTALTVLTREQAARVDRANAYWEGERNSARGMCLYAFLLGTELHALKEENGHGDWMDFRAAHFPSIPHRTATERIAMAEKLAESANLTTTGMKLLPDGSVPKPFEEKITKAFHEHADGKTITQFLRGNGTIRDAKAPKGTGKKSKIDLDGDDASALADLRQDLILLANEDDQTLEAAETADLLKFKPVLDAFVQRFNAELKRRKTKH